ncbi:MAG: DJ-1/PfpI family protein [Nanoarchaeota archaeon]|nr:DJ-1/PfpI family protein [Nanoarchaeota archaeon]MBU4352614.1 DJ-1/PfpI family protein [Nanoarchaeota archaeon]
MKKILFIIAQDFRDEELLEPMTLLAEQGCEIKIAAEKIEIIMGVKKVQIMPDMDLEEAAINLNNFKAIIFVGGPGAKIYFDNVLCHEIIKEAHAKRRIIAAICIAPIILAKAGILQGYHATVFTSTTDKHYADGMRIRGAKYVAQDVVVDRNIITAKGSHVATKFGLAIAELMEEKR